MRKAPSLFRNVLLPVASEADARATAKAVEPYLRDSERQALVVHVIEKAGGAPDKASVEQRKQNAQEIFDAFAEAVTDSGFDYETEILYGTDIAETIIQTADDIDASAIAFTPREASRWKRLLSGDTALSLVTESDRPVLVLPNQAGDTDG